MAVVLAPRILTCAGDVAIVFSTLHAVDHRLDHLWSRFQVAEHCGVSCRGITRRELNIKYISNSRRRNIFHNSFVVNTIHQRKFLQYEWKHRSLLSTLYLLLSPKPSGNICKELKEGKSPFAHYLGFLINIKLHNDVYIV